LRRCCWWWCSCIVTVCHRKGLSLASLRGFKEPVVILFKDQDHYAALVMTKVFLA